VSGESHHIRQAKTSHWTHFVHDEKDSLFVSDVAQGTEKLGRSMIITALFNKCVRQKMDALSRSKGTTNPIEWAQR
jgi:hypothetical protein